MESPKQFKVLEIPKSQTYEWCLKKHYAHRIPSISYAFGLYDSAKVLVGISTYGMCPGREVSNLCGDKYSGSVLEMNRVIKNDGLPDNTQSYFLSQTFKMLPNPTIIVSYADPNQNHHGYVYQALNFIYTGTSRSVRTYIYNNTEWHERHVNKVEFFVPLRLPYNDEKSIMWNFSNVGGVVDIDKPKHRYVLFVADKRTLVGIKRAFKWQSLPYPKGDNVKYDTSYKPSTQGVLI